MKDFIPPTGTFSFRYFEEMLIAITPDEKVHLGVLDVLCHNRVFPIIMADSPSEYDELWVTDDVTFFSVCVLTNQGWRVIYHDEKGSTFASLAYAYEWAQGNAHLYLF